MSDYLRFVDKAPFSGKFSIREAMVSHRLAGKENERKTYGRATRFLSSMIGCHALQAYLGTETFLRLATGDTMFDVVGAGISGVYAAANAAVTLRQAELLHSTYALHRERLQEDSPLYERQQQKPRTRELGRKGIGLAVTSTLLAQIVTGGVMLYAQYKHSMESCYGQAAQDYAQFTNSKPGEHFEPLDDYTARVCHV